MSPAFADTSAVVKLYAEEDGSALVRTIDALVLSPLTRVEVPSAIWRKQRQGELTLAEALVLIAAFDGDYLGTGDQLPLFSVTSLGPTILDRAAALLEHHPLKASDGVQLASALAVRAADPEVRSFASYDVRLREAAAREGFELVPAEL